jgi:hypothetical protein
MTQKCGRCIYVTTDGAGFWCRRFPPSIPSPLSGFQPTFPLVGPGDWCGEYKYDSKNEDKKTDSNKEATDLVIAHYKSEFNRVFGAIPQLSVKDRSAAKVLAKEHSQEQAARIITEFLTIPPQWNKERGAYDLKFIPSNANSILARGKGIAEDDTLSYLKSQAEHRHSPRWFEYVDYVKKSGKRVSFKRYSLEGWDV